MKLQTTIKMKDRVAKTFALCIHEQCPMAESCLHRTMWNTVSDSKEHFSIISPSRTTPDGECCYFARQNAPSTLAVSAACKLRCYRNSMLHLASD